MKIVNLNTDTRLFQSRGKKILLPGLLTSVLLSGCQTMGKAAPEAAMKGAEPIQTTAELLREGDMAVSQNNSDLAKIKYALALELDSQNLDAMYKLGVLHQHSGALSVSEGLLRRVRELAPGHLDAREELGLVLLKNKQMKEAEVLLEEALEARPGSAKVLNAMGIVKDMKAEHDQAQAMFQAALTISPDSAKIQNNLGYSFYLDGDLDNAERHIRNATDIDSDYLQAWSNLALVYSRQGRVSESRSAFNKVVSEHQTANNIGYLQLLQNNDVVARDELKKAVTLSSAYYEIANENLEALDRPRNLSEKSAKVRNISKDLKPVHSSADELTAANTLVVGKRESVDKMSVRETQVYLNFLGYRAGNPDGRFGALTRDALKKFQSNASLVATGRNTSRTQQRLNIEVVTKVQKTLTMLGHNAGRADGVIGSSTTNAINGFRRSRRMPGDGEIDETLLESLQESLSQNVEKLSNPKFLDISGRG